MQQSRPDAARKEYEQALSLLPAETSGVERGIIHTQLGVCLVSLQRRREAAENFEAALAADPSNVQARKLLAAQQRALGSEAIKPGTAVGSGDQADARAILERAIATSPRDAANYASLARALHRENAPHAALQALETAVALQSDPIARASAQHNAGVLQLGLGRTRDAMASLQAAARAQPAHLPTQVLLRITRPLADARATGRLRGALTAATAAAGRGSGKSRVTTTTLSAAAAAPAANEGYYVTLAQTFLDAASASSSPHHPPPAPPELPPSAPPPPLGSPPPLGATLADALASRGYVVVDGVLGAAALAQLHRAPSELTAAFAPGSTGKATEDGAPRAVAVEATGATVPLGHVASAPSAHAEHGHSPSRTDMVVRLPHGDSEALAKLSSPLRNGLDSLRGLLLGSVHPALLRVRPRRAPPLWPREELQLACYGEGSFYLPHEDEEGGGEEVEQTMGEGGGDVDGSISHEEDYDDEAAEGAMGGAADSGHIGSLRRRYTAIYYVSEPGVRWGDTETSGGALRIWPHGSYEAVTLAPLADRLVIFESRWTHEVMPVLAAANGARRCAFTQWFSGLDAAPRTVSDG